MTKFWIMINTLMDYIGGISMLTATVMLPVILWCIVFRTDSLGTVLIIGGVSIALSLLWIAKRGVQ